MPPEIVFDRGVGDVLVVRTPAQTLDPLVVGSVELGASEIGVPLVFVLGHERCGAVTAAIEAIEHHGGDAPGRIQKVVDALRPAYAVAAEQPGDLVENMVRAQIRLATARLRRAELLEPLLDERRLAIVGGRYDLETGAVTLLSR